MAIKPTHWLLLFFCLGLAACGGPSSDQERVVNILRNTAWSAGRADTTFQEALATIGSLRAGRPAYQVADTLKQQFEQIDSYVVSLARPYENEAKDIESPVAREQVREGIKAIHAVYDQRRAFVRDAQTALNSGDGGALLAAAKKRKAEQAAEEVRIMVAMAFFSEAKKAVGLPTTLDEFKQ